MRCMRPGLICRSDFNRPNFRALYTAKASAFRLNAFRTLAMSSQSMPSALRFELNARCSVSLIRPYETKKVALTNLRPPRQAKQGLQFSICLMDQLNCPFSCQSRPKLPSKASLQSNLKIQAAGYASTTPITLALSQAKLYWTQ
jgi:hypothetical protein